MKYVNSGNGRIPLLTLIAILSISLTINLPGLAVSPMLGKLHHIFNSSELESQLLTSLPNLFMIPVVIIAGRLSTPSRQTAILIIGLLLFLISGIASFFMNSMIGLIIMGCLGGIGCGMVVPIAAGYISEWFIGEPRQRDLGLKSTTSNATVILANIFVGFVVVVNWHAAFAVYLIPIIPLCLVPFLTQRFVTKYNIHSTSLHSSPTNASSMSNHFSGPASRRMLIALIALYLILTYATTSISYYAPFVMDHFNMTTTQVGLVTAAYYLMCAVFGALLTLAKRLMRSATIIISLAMCALGLFIIGFTHSFIIYLLASTLTGIGYGIIQPIIYNKVTYVAPTRRLATTYFGYVLSANYMAIMLVPFIDSAFRSLFRATAPGFDFILSGTVVLGLLIWSIIWHKNYVFSANPTQSAPTTAELSNAKLYNTRQ